MLLVNCPRLLKICTIYKTDKGRGQQFNGYSHGVVRISYLKIAVTPRFKERLLRFLLFHASTSCGTTDTVVQGSIISKG